MTVGNRFFEVEVDPPHKRCAKDLKRFLFDGAAAEFRCAFSQYLTDHGATDPFARNMFSSLLSETYVLSFRSLSTDRDTIQREWKLRLSLLLEFLPLDQQLSFIATELDHYSWQNFDINSLSWSQLDSIQSLPSQDRDAAFKGSPLGGWLNPTSPAPKSPIVFSKNKEKTPYLWEDMASRIKYWAHTISSGLIFYEHWDQLSNLWTHAGVSPLDAVSTFYMNYQRSSSRGTFQIESESPIPFWAVGVFNKAESEMFWEVVKKHGGPPCAFNFTEDAPSENNQVTFNGFVGNFDPVALVNACDNANPYDQKMMHIDQIRQTLSAWRHRDLSVLIQQDSTSPCHRQPAPKF